MMMMMKGAHDVNAAVATEIGRPFNCCSTAYQRSLRT